MVLVGAGRLVGTPWRDEKEVPREGDGTGEASRAICVCRSGAGDVERTEEVEIGIDRGGFKDEPSPLSAMMD